METRSPFDVPDLVTVIAELCPPDALNKLASVNTFCRKKIISDSKDKYITILEYKYQKVR